MLHSHDRLHSRLARLTCRSLVPFRGRQFSSLPWAPETLATPLIVIAERFRFHKRNQRSGESISEYCIAIQKLSEHCDFGTTLNTALRDRLVCGLANEYIQRKLLADADLTYDQAKAIALAAETATKDSEELRKQPMVDTSVNKLLQARPSRRGHVPTRAGQPTATATATTATAYCVRCGKRNHTQDQCYFRDKQCHTCMKTGHIKRMCQNGKQHKLNANKGNVHYVDGSLNADDESNEISDSEAILFYVGNDENHTVGSVTAKPLVVNMLVNGVNIDMEIDSGAPVSIMPQTQFEKYFGLLKLNRPDVRLLANHSMLLGSHLLK